MAARHLESLVVRLRISCNFPASKLQTWILEMLPTLTTRPGSDTSPIGFTCPHCGQNLSVPRAQAEVSGPCPSCQAIVSAPRPQELLPSGDVIPREKTYKPIEGTLTSPRSVSSSGRQRRIAADAIVDHDRLERAETTKSLVIITLFILAFCICLAVVWFMKDWMGK